MTLSLAAFRVRYNEFEVYSDALCTAAIAEAAEECDPRIFGATTGVDIAVGLLAAHKLSISPGGQQARLEAKGGDGTTTYLAEWNRLAQKRAGGPWVTGQGPTGLLP